MKIFGKNNTTALNQGAIKTRLIDDIVSKVKLASLTKFRQASAFYSLRPELNSASPAELKDVLQKIAVDPKGSNLLDQLAPVLSLKKLEAAANVSAADCAKEWHRSAEKQLTREKGNRLHSAKALFALSIHTLLSMLESFVYAFGITDFFRSPENRSDAKDKIEGIKLMLQFAIVAAAALPLIGTGAATLSIGAIFFFLSIWILSAIYPSVRGIPAFLVCPENWTHQFRFGFLSEGEGRRGPIDEIARVLIASKGEGSHPLLLGKPGVGKTETAKMFVAAIERGKYPALLGKQVFYFNASDSMDQGSCKKTLSRIREMSDDQKKSVILIVDNIDKATQNTVPFFNLLPSDNPSNKGMPYILAISSNAQWLKKLPPALAKRFKPIPVQNTTPAETTRILENVLRKEDSNVFLAPNALETLMKKAKNVFGKELAEPAASLKFLSACIKKTAECKKTSTEQNMEQILSQIDALNVQYPRDQKEIERLEIDLRRLEMDLAEEKAEAERLDKDQKQLAAMRRSLCQKALKVTLPSTSEQDKAKFLMQSQFIIPELEEKIKQASLKLGMRLTIESSLMEEVSKEEERSL